MADGSEKSVSSGDLQDLAVAVEQLTEETRLLRMSLDELRDDVVWAARQILAGGYQVTGMAPPPPRDPLTPDMATNPTCRREHGLEIEHAVDTAHEATESGPYCCDHPNLQWNGDPDAPGIVCENCGYVVAEHGSVAIWRSDDDAQPTAADRPPPSPQVSTKQGSLFGGLDD